LVLVHKIIASTLSTAAVIKNGSTEPNQLNRYGNANAVIKDPTFPAIFIVPETAPAFFFPISTQKLQLGLNVISAQKFAIYKKTTAPKAVSMYRLAIKPIVASAKPRIAGNLLESLHIPLE
jgi:hypothetical protein